jgi:hypothetical protein
MVSKAMNTTILEYNLLHPSFGIVEEIFCIQKILNMGRNLLVYLGNSKF